MREIEAIQFGHWIQALDLYIPKSWLAGEDFSEKNLGVENLETNNVLKTKTRESTAQVKL